MKQMDNYVHETVSAIVESVKKNKMLGKLIKNDILNISPLLSSLYF